MSRQYYCLYSVLLQDDTIGPDPFYDLEQHALLGVANISLECLLHDIEFVYDAPIVAPTGKVRFMNSALCTLHFVLCTVLLSPECLSDLWKVETFGEEGSK